MATYKAAKYIRLSYTDDKTVESDSVSNQRKMLDDFIAKNPDIEPVSEAIDDGVSGIIFDRPAFKEMMKDIEDGKINCVICKDLSRIGREYIETGRYLRRIFPAYGVRFIAINDNIDTLKDNADDLVVSVKSIINDAYCRDISVKTRSALNVKRQNGDYVGACPVYGYKKSENDKNQLVIDEKTAPVVRDIFRLKSEGYSALKIAENLNLQGILSPYAYKKYHGLPCPKNGFADKSESKWSATTIIRILKDETYTGVLLQGKQGTLNYKIKDVIDKPVCDWKRTENAHEAIIKKEEFQLIQKILRLDTRTAPNSDNLYLFSGMLICGCCGERMTRKTVPYKGKNYYYYWCPKTKKRGCEHPPTIKEEDLINAVLESVKSHIANIASIENVLANSDYQKVIDNLKKQYASQMAENQAQLEKIESFKSSLYENMVNGILTKEDFKSLKAKYSTDEERLKNANKKLKNSLNEAISGNSERLKWMDYFKKFEGLTELDRWIVTNLIGSIKIVTKTELVITFNYQNEYETALLLAGKVA